MVISTLRRWIQSTRQPSRRRHRHERRSVIRTQFESLEPRSMMAADLIPGAYQAMPATPIAHLNGDVYFGARVTVNGLNHQELWKSDGNAAQMVEDFGPFSSGPDDLTVLNGNLYFFASGNDPKTNLPTGYQLWASDGAANTRPITSINPPPGLGGLGFAGHLAEVNGAIVFRGSDQINGAYQLWKVDNSVRGASPLTVFPDQAGSGVDDAQPALIGQELFFAARDPNDGEELFRTDGTPGNTLKVVGTQGTSPANLTVSNGQLFFSAVDAVHGRELWVCDALGDNPHMVADINQQPGRSGINPFTVDLTDVNGTVYFIGNDGQNGQELWSSDGVHTQQIMGVAAGTLTNFDGTLFFSAFVDNSNPHQLWKLTPGGPVEVADVANAVGLGLADFTVVNGTLFFTADDAVNGREVWQVNPAANGAQRVTDINPGVGSSNPSSLTNVNGILYFTATTDGAEDQRQLYLLSPQHDANVRFVNQFYLDLVHRQPTAVELNNWVGMLDRGVAHDQVVAGFEQTQVYRAAVVQDLFAHYLHRAASAAEVTYYSGFFAPQGPAGIVVGAAGGAVVAAPVVNLATVTAVNVPLHGAQAIIAALVSSAEYFQNRGLGTNAGFLNALYLDTLNRAPTLQEQQQFMLIGFNRQQVAVQILEGKEYLQDLVQSYYQRFLHRAANLVELNNAVGVLLQGAPDEQVIAAIIGSPEYFAQF